MVDYNPTMSARRATTKLIGRIRVPRGILRSHLAKLGATGHVRREAAEPDKRASLAVGETVRQKVVKQAPPLRGPSTAVSTCFAAPVSASRRSEPKCGQATALTHSLAAALPPSLVTVCAQALACFTGV